MKKLLIICLTFVAVMNASAQKIYNDANAEVRKLSGSFSEISVSNSIDLYLTQSGEEAVAVSAASTEYRDKIRVTIDGGVLRISLDDNNKMWKNNGNRKLKAYVSFKTLNKLSASGASDVYVETDIKSNELVLRFSGASDFKGQRINANELSVNISGASDINIKGGTVTTLKVDASGASDFNGYDLIADNCSAEASGASDIKITVNNELNVRASGASGVHYKGNGKIRDLKTSGASSVNRKS